MAIKARRICWPNPDATCLEGGCSYCNDFTFKPIEQIREYCSGKEVSHRGNNQIVDAVEAFYSGYDNDFFNAEVRHG